ncbi:MAG TPA: iron-sulfur cluster assembly scaffold protein [Gemmatimonadaceae bacterium]|nr:iron-sulfur cluster assembly scaffold protein [Gemmatimonadaceae bacterium]
MGGALPYGATVLEHFRRPRNQRKLERATVARDGHNPLCGDRVRIELLIENAIISDAAFTANACAICTASASLLTERVRGHSVDDAAAISDQDLLAALDAELPPARLVCAILPVRTLREAIAGAGPPLA